MTEMLKGIAASDGVAVAKAYLLVQPDLSFETASVEDTNAEEARLDAALEASQNELSVIREKAVETLGEEAAQVFDAHLMVLSDPEMIGQIKETIRAKKVNAESGLKEVTDMFITLFENMEDNPYMQERAADIRDVTKRVLAHLLGVRLPNPAMINEEVVVIAHDLTPSDTAQLDLEHCAGFLTEIGGKTAHSAIMARSLEIPAIVGVGNVMTTIKEGEEIIIDGEKGELFISPTPEIIAEYKEMREQFLAEKEALKKLKNLPATTIDGRTVKIQGNIGKPEDVDAVIEAGAEGIGLYRTEFLFMDTDHMPTEAEQYVAYKTVVEKMKGKPVTIRTMDIGGDKVLPYLDLPTEMNPFLGYRAIRISLAHKDMFKTQLRAILRASAYGKVKIMYPMVCSINEIRKSNQILEECKKELDEIGKLYDKNIEVGIMVETPSTAMIAYKFAKEVDFFSIGTNDLTQYFLAVDRGNEKVSSLYTAYNPAVLEAIQKVIDAGHDKGITVSMCGEFAGDKKATEILLGMGLDSFSMSASSILGVKKKIIDASYASAQKYRDLILSKDTPEEVLECLV